MHEVYLYEDGDEWVVRSGSDERRFGDRPAAFAVAKDHLRAHAPSTLVAGPPGSGADDTAAGPGAPVEPVAPIWGDERWPDEADAPAEDPPTRPTRPQVSADPSPAEPARSAPAARPFTPRLTDSSVDWERLRGPAVLGRSLLVTPGAPVPAPWDGAERVRVGADLDLDRVREAFLTRRPVVYELALGDDARDGEVWNGEVWAAPPDLDLAGDDARTLLLANAVDARDPDAPSWPWAGVALAAGAAAPTVGGPPGDVVLPDGGSAWCDGGPLRLWTSDEPGIGVPVLPRVAVELGSLTPPGSDGPTAALAPDQLAAVAEPGATARIIAPAGSGKTRVLTERARHLLTTAHLPPSALTLVAFNKRAQEEMRERTRDLQGLQIQTLNALALAVLNGTSGFRSRGTRVQTIDEAQVRRLLADLVSFPRRANTDPAAAWIDALSMVRLGLRSPAEVEASFGGDVDGFAEVYPRYRRALRQAGVVDFDEQIHLAIEALLTEPATRHQAQRQCRVLLVDEFQDLTPAHVLLVRLLAGADLNVFGVGDDDQTIYGYSGASPQWLIDFDHYFPGATHHALHVNYRCPVPVVTAAANLLTRNRSRVPKEIHHGPDNPTGPAGLEVLVGDDPVATTVARVAALVEAGVPPTEIAVLTRVNTLLAPIQVALHLAGIPARSQEGGRFLERTGVAAALSWLRLAVGTGRMRPDDVGRAARRPGRSLSPKVIEWMAEQGDRRGLDRLAARLNNERDADKVTGFAVDVDRIRARARNADTAGILEFVRSGIGLDAAMATLDAGRRGRNTSGHSDDLRALIALGRLHTDPGGFSRWLEAVLRQGWDDTGVTLATVHKVKGLEWPHVVVHDATQGVFPHRLSLDVEEERRVFHVALTRGRQTVTVVGDAAQPSMFLDELREPAPPRPDPTGPPPGPGHDDRGRPQAATPGRGPQRPADPVEVAAAVGLTLTWGSYEGEITSVEGGQVTLQVGRAELMVPIGSVVEVDGRRGTLGPPAAASRPSKRSGRSSPVDAGDADPTVLEALKAWRLERSRADKVPAYVVFNDRTLVEIATALPASAEQLRTIGGVGPAKLERYADEVLAVLDEHRASS